jgi:2,3-bisphosphoglycerate-independent phosphoglycerate mutase
MRTHDHDRPPVALIILDGWGLADRHDADATWLASAKVMRRIAAEYPTARLEAAGEAVGLPDGVIGNSEVGHLNLGAGRVVYQDLTRIHMAIRDRAFFANPALLAALDGTRDRAAAVHLIGLCSDAGVHSHLDHLKALLDLARERRVERVFIHAITDGRDSDPRAGAGYLDEVARHAAHVGVGVIASVVGRYYAMDRDRRWERTRRAYDAIVRGEAPLVDDPIATVHASYAAGVTDEFVEPVCVRGPANGGGGGAGAAAGRALGPVGAGDVAISFNFRADRARQLTRALTDPAFDGFDRGPNPPAIELVAMTRYEEGLRARVAFEPQGLDGLLGQCAAGAGLAQLRLAETEKYAHVTYFFNGGEEPPYPGEERILVPSNRAVPTYDLAPEMRAREIADEAVKRLRLGPRPDLIVLNFANADMVGHTGKLAETCRAVEAVDANLGRVLEAIHAIDGVALVTADHGNAEVMVDPETGRPHTAHTTNPVPVTLVGERFRGGRLRAGKLCDVAPTLLELLGLPRPAAMTGTPLLHGAHREAR